MMHLYNSSVITTKTTYNSIFVCKTNVLKLKNSNTERILATQLFITFLISFCYTVKTAHEIYRKSKKNYLRPASILEPTVAYLRCLRCK